MSDTNKNKEHNRNLNFKELIDMGSFNRLNFAKLNRLNIYDPNANSQSTNSFKKYTREQILTYSKDPRKNSDKIIEASVYLYATSTIYKRICTYFADMLTFDYIISPSKLKEYDNSPNTIDKYMKAYIKCLSQVDNMNIKQTFNNISRTVVREGAFFGLEISNNDSYTIYQLPYNRCKVTSWEDGTPIFSLDMSYFNNNLLLIESIGGNVKSAYESYKKDSTLKWAEMDGSSSICILADESLDYIIPPLAGCFSDVYLIEDYKDLVKSKEEIGLYKLLNLKLPLDKDGELAMDEILAKDFYRQMADQLPDNIGLTLNPFAMDSISFDNNNSDRDSTSRAERDLWSNVGVSSLIFNNEKASSTALLQSLTNDLSFMKPILRSLERWLNKKLKLMSGSVKFKAIFPDVSEYNWKDYADSIRKDMVYGLPVKSLLAAVGGSLSPSDVLGMSFLENEVIKTDQIFKVPISANTVSNSETSAGRPTNESVNDNTDDNLDRV